MSKVYPVKCEALFNWGDLKWTKMTKVIATTRGYMVSDVRPAAWSLEFETQNLIANESDRLASTKHLRILSRYKPDYNLRL